MLKLILSAFALSLSTFQYCASAQTQRIDEFREVHIEDILEIETDEMVDSNREILPELKGFQKFTSPDHHEKVDWKVTEKEVEVDTSPLKGQSFSLIPWSTQKPEDFLSIEKWMADRSFKDKNPDWKIRLRELSQTEILGKLIQCRGTCEVFRGSNKAKVQHLSTLNEGDELRTGLNSSAWVFLMDGSLMRLGAETSISLIEFNLSDKAAFHFYRLNQGHVFWNSRTESEYIADLAPETDSFNLPLPIKEANQAHFEREIFKSQNDFERSLEFVKLDDSAALKQVKNLNELKLKNNKIGLFSSRMMMIAPNVSLLSDGASLDLIYRVGGKSYFKKRSNLENQNLKIQLRGYSQTDVSELTDPFWFEVAENGRNFSKAEDDLGYLEITELITKRIRTIEYARELWIEKYVAPILAQLGHKDKIAVQFGYKIWGDEGQKRFDFMFEYMRRIETSNLKAIDILLDKNEIHAKKGVGTEHFQSALNAYLLGLKKRYTDKRMQVREMTDLQYHVWVLRNGR
jgi:hypothetical protein